MLRLPICGFARRVEDSVARAMAILNTREDHTARGPVPQFVMQAPRFKKPAPRGPSAKLNL
jgi:hypothetical protein